MQRTSASRTSEPPRRGGFTLIELLVVLFVVAMMAGITVIRLGDRDRDRALEAEAERLARVIELAREQALLENREWGLALTDAGYRFLVLDEESGLWEPTGAGAFAPHTLPEDVGLRLRVEGGRIAPAAASGRGRRPDLLILSSGEITPFRAVLSTGDTAAWRVTSDGFGAARTVAPEAGAAGT